MITVTDQTQFKNAITALEPEIFVANNISLTSPTSIRHAVTITGAPDVSLLWTSPRASARDMLIVTSSGDLTIGDLILDAEDRDGTLVQVTGGRFTMNEGAILRNISGRTAQNAVSLGDIASADGGTFIMNGGLITGVDSSDAVFCGGGTTVVMNNDAAIDNNLSAGLSAANILGLRFSLTMTGHSRISNNESRQGANAGIIMDGDVVMGVNEGDAPIITGNHSSQYPVGGLLMSENSTLTMRYGAEISDNYSAQYGGGVVIDTGALSMYGNAAIKNNRSDSFCGGLLTADCTVTIEDDAQISGNSCEGQGGGLNLQFGSSLQMSGNSAIHSNTAINGGGVFLHNSSAAIGQNNSSPQIYGNASAGLGGGVFISTGGLLDLTGRTRIFDNTAAEGNGIYKLGNLNLSESPQILDGLFFDALDIDGYTIDPPPEITLIKMQLPLDSPDNISIELPFITDATDPAMMQKDPASAFSPSYTDNVPVIVVALTNVAKIQLEASAYVSPPNVPLVIADKGPSYARLTETDRAAWLIPPTFGSKYRVILNPGENQVLIDFQAYTITYENLYDSTHSNPLSYVAADLPITLSDPNARSGYTFAGWFDNQGQRVTQITEAIGDIILTAAWEDHMLSFDGNDPNARNVPESIRVENGQKLQIPTDAPCRPCHCFVCWNMPSSGSGKVFFPGDTIVIGTESIKLYAQWRSVCCGCHDKEQMPEPKPRRYAQYY